MARLEIKQVTVLRDNYVYLVNHRGSGTAAVIDPGIAGPVVTELDNLGWRLRKVFSTHHHADQIGGNLDMKNAYS
jgi:hydroxyacylglutathione hydrolase